MTPIYLHDWAEGGEAQMLYDFEIGPDALVRVTVLVASYTYEDYNGDAYVLFERDGKLWEVHGSHCSCYGLEEQWEPEQTDEASIRHRFTKGYFGRDTGLPEAILSALAARESGE